MSQQSRSQKDIDVGKKSLTVLRFVFKWETFSLIFVALVLFQSSMNQLLLSDKWSRDPLSSQVRLDWSIFKTAVRSSAIVG